MQLDAGDRHVNASIVLLVVALTAFRISAGARSSQLIDRDARNVRLLVNAKGEALVTYSANGQTRHVIAWGAVNALAPTRSRQQVTFRLDYAGGWGKYHRDYWRTFDGNCGAYDGPPLAWNVRLASVGRVLIQNPAFGHWVPPIPTAKMRMA